MDETTEEHGFTETKYLCVGIVDILRFTELYSWGGLERVAKYYIIFFNTMAAIARNFGAEVVKNVGDSLIFFFPKTSEPSSDKTPFKDVLRCGLAMQTAYDDLNQKYYEEHLPPINYRISADYGKTEVTKSKDSSIIDVLGPTLNICVKINIKAPPNRMVIGENLYDMINNSFEGDYHFTKIHEYPLDKNDHSQNPYSVYLISRNG
jgi:class 3 adenylate cyclase